MHLLKDTNYLDAVYGLSYEAGNGIYTFKYYNI